MSYILDDNKIIQLEMTTKRALELGLLFCTCGHPPNNHFNHGKCPCAHCDCKEFTLAPKSGTRLIRNPHSKETK